MKNLPHSMQCCLLEDIVEEVEEDSEEPTDADVEKTFKMEWTPRQKTFWT